MDSIGFSTKGAFREGGENEGEVDVIVTQYLPGRFNQRNRAETCKETPSVHNGRIRLKGENQGGNVTQPGRRVERTKKGGARKAMQRMFIPLFDLRGGTRLEIGDLRMGPRGPARVSWIAEG